MSRISFESYGEKAKEWTDPTLIAGRYIFQKGEERNILADVMDKLAITPEDACLEIGCGIGNILIPLSFLVDSITGIDHPDCIKALKSRFKNENVNLYGTNFIDWENSARKYFDKILIYSVLHLLQDKDEVMFFIHKALSMLNSGGKILLGDIPNISKKERFVHSAEGKAFNEKWKERNQEHLHKEYPAVPVDSELATFDDKMMLSIIAELRGQGCNAYILPQPHALPFGYTREDILIEKL